MPNVKTLDLLHRRKNERKKRTSLAAITIVPGDVGAATASIAVQIPARAIIKEVYFHTETNVDMGDITLDSVDREGNLDGRLLITHTPTTPEVTANLLPAPIDSGPGGMYISYFATAEQTMGLTTLVISYDEPNITSGELMKVDVASIDRANLRTAP